jgi:hypothetical protein
MENGDRVVGRGLIWWSAVMAALSYIAGTLTLSDLVGDRYAAVFFLIVGALNTGTAVYVGTAHAPPAAPRRPYKP